MTEILFIKTSSLGDVLHHMPAVSDARRRFPHARFTWIVEEAYAPLARLHPAVDEVLPVASRRWRKTLHSPATWREIAKTFAKLRARRYDAIIDTQGLIRTALIARLLRGRSHGYDSGSVREALAARFYQVRHAVPRALHAVERNRRLVSLALGYEPGGPLDYGLGLLAMAADRSTRRAVLLHATARPEKEWPEESWIETGKALAARGLQVGLPWGNAAERRRSERLAAAIPGAQVPDLLPLPQLGTWMAGAELVVGVDTGLLHLAAALAVPLVAVLVHPKSLPTVPMGAGPIEIVGSGQAAPSAVEVMAAIERVTAPAPGA